MRKKTAVTKILGLHELFFPCFLTFVESKKKNYQRKSSTLKHAVVNNSKCSKMESRIVRLFKVSFNLTQTHEVSNRKSQKTKLFHNMYYMTLLRYKFSQKEKKKKSYISIPKISIYFLKHFYFFHFIST